jgi:uncharacterized protein (DUF1800 family)
VDALLHPEEEPEVDAIADRHLPYRSFPMPREMVGWWMELMLRSRHPFRDVMALFWHDHFATSFTAFDSASMHMLLQQIEKLRALGMGNVRTLLRTMTADPAMLVWLDAVDSTAAEPNENLARELFELFALGVDNGYTQADIVEAARALTGYRLTMDPATGLARVVFDVARHDGGVKTIFGHSGRFGLLDLVDLTIDQRPVAEFLCRRLFEHFCYAPAPDELVVRLATILREGDYELRPVLRVLLRSRAFFADASRRAHVKNPIEAAVGMLRDTGLAHPMTSIDYFVSAAGQRLFAPPSVAGWPTGADWLTATTLLARRNLLHAISVGRRYQTQQGTPIEALLPPPAERTAGAVIAALADRLGLSLGDEDRAIYAAYLDTRATLRDGNLETSPDPFVGDHPEHVSERVRGLLFLLTQHPAYFLR